VTSDRSGTLHIVAKNDSPMHRLAVARRHIETAISHLNDVAQARVPAAVAGNVSDVDELRLIVRALADIREALRTSEWAIGGPMDANVPLEH
jgi:hypothetical protein